MKGIAAAVAAAALLGTAPAGARPSDDELFCRDLRRVIEAANDDYGFVMLERSRAAPPTLGFDGGCAATGNSSRRYWLCHQPFAPESMALEPLAARVAACLPEAVRGERSMYREATFTVPHAEIRLYEHGGPGAHVGRVAELVVEAKPAP